MAYHEDYDLLSAKRGFFGPTFSWENRIRRALWKLAWFLLAAWTPPFLHRWRIAVLRLFGASVSWRAYVYRDVDVWAPWHLTLGDFATLASGVVCYNIAPITVGPRAVISQGAHLYTGTHDHEHPDFPLVARPISVGTRVWICADTFVGPGVNVGDGAVLGAGAVALRDLEPWTVYAGNPAVAVKPREPIKD